MALCDDPLAVSTGQAWVGVRPRTRVPIYITANDLTCLYAVSSCRVPGSCQAAAWIPAVGASWPARLAGVCEAKGRVGCEPAGAACEQAGGIPACAALGQPGRSSAPDRRMPSPPLPPPPPCPVPSRQPLVREGRMDKFYYEPTRGEMAAALRALFEPELDAAGVEALLDAFPSQVGFGERAWGCACAPALRTQAASRAVRDWACALLCAAVCLPAVPRKGVIESLCPRPGAAHGLFRGCQEQDGRPLGAAVAGCSGGARAGVRRLSPSLARMLVRCAAVTTPWCAPGARELLAAPCSGAATPIAPAARKELGSATCTAFPFLASAFTPKTWERLALQSLDNALLSGSGAPPSMIAFEASLAAALAAGAELAAEQQAVLDIRLSVEYMKGLDSETQEDMEVWRQQWQQAREEREARRRAAAEAAEVVREAAAAAVRQAAAAEAAATAAAGGPSVEQQHGQEEEQEEEAEQAAAQAATPSGLPACTPDELAVALRDRSVVAIDVRSARDWDWGRINGAAHAPYVVTSGSSLAPEVGPGWEQGVGPWDVGVLHFLWPWRPAGRTATPSSQASSPGSTLAFMAPFMHSVLA